jgi:hypothetical protein
MLKPRCILRVLAAAAAVAFLGAPAEAYYHYVYFNGRSAPFSPINAHYDLTKLANNTVVFCVYGAGPTNLYPNDSFASVLAEVKQAINSWNAVPNSALHVAFGGLEYAGQNANTPGGDVVFEDLPPGLLGVASPNLPAAPQFSTTAAGVPFVPISRSTVYLTDNTATLPGPSYLEMFFTTAVHEFGHALGMQHTWTGSAMSQDVIRNTSRARPLDADDIAGFLELYGASGWTSNYGSISGTVSFSTGGAVALASVVAIPPTGPAVSALTNPDGTYTINGLPPNNYLLYVHPLPPDAIASDGTGLLLPSDQSGVSFSASRTFRTVFYPNTLDPTQATQLTVSGGTNLSQQNFTVQSNTGVPAYDLQVYSYEDRVNHNYLFNPTSSTNPTVKPAFLNTSLGNVEFVVEANSGSVTAPQSIAILGVATAKSCAVANVSPCFWPFQDPTYLALAGYFGVSSSLGTGARHLVFNYGNDLYVMPDGVIFVSQGPPYINSVTSNGDGTVTVSGGNFGPDSRVFFDGLHARATAVPTATSITVTPPSGMSGHLSAVTVFNSDGQNSLQFYDYPNQAPTFQYSAAPTPQIVSVTPSALPTGNSGAPYSAAVTITTQNTNFVDGMVSVGAGSSDMTVSRVWVLDPTHLMANVTVAPGAAIGMAEVSVISGFQVMTSIFGTLPSDGTLPLISGILGAGSYLPTVYPGGYGSVYGLNLQDGAAPTATLNGTPVAVQYFPSANQANFLAPAGFSTGPATLNLSNGTGSVSIGVPIGNPPPTIQGLSNSQGTVDGTHPANVGDVLTVLVSGIDPSSVPAVSRLQVTVSGLSMAVLQIAPASNNQVQIQFVLTQSFGGSQVPVTVSLDGSPSNPYTISAR